MCQCYNVISIVCKKCRGHGVSIGEYLLDQAGKLLIGFSVGEGDEGGGEAAVVPGIVGSTVGGAETLP